jgi:hypothetical protein
LINTRYISLLAIVIAFALGGCNPGIVAPVPPQVTDASAYFFPKISGATMVFGDSALYPTRGYSTINLSFSDSSTNSFYAVERGIDSFSCNLGTDAVTISGITTHSIIPLPSGFSIQSVRDSVPVSVPIPINHIIATTSNSIVVSNDSLGIYFSTDAGATWTHSANSEKTFGKSTYVTSFAVYSGNVYALNKSESLYYSSDNGSSWQLTGFNSKGTAMTSTASGLFVTDGSNIYLLQSPTGNLTKFTSKQTSFQITSLAVATIDSSKVFIGATGTGALYYWQDTALGTSDWIRASDSITSVRMVIATPLGHFYCSTMSGNGGKIYSSETGRFWSLRDTGMSYAMLTYCTNQVVAVSPSGAVHTLSDQSPYLSGKPVASLSGVSVNDLSGLGSNCYAATTGGIALSKDAGSNWSFSSTGVSSTHYTITESPGSIVLLHTKGGSFDSSWQACTMFKNQTTIPIVITGRIVSRLDSLSIGGKTYPDILEARYSNETAGVLNTIDPYFDIFFAKNQGPVLIYEFVNLSAPTQASQKIFRLSK